VRPRRMGAANGFPDGDYRGSHVTTVPLLAVEEDRGKGVVVALELTSTLTASDALELEISRQVRVRLAKSVVNRRRCRGIPASSRAVLKSPCRWHQAEWNRVSLRRRQKDTYQREFAHPICYRGSIWTFG